MIIGFRKNKLPAIYPFIHSALIESLLWTGPVLGAGNTELDKADKVVVLIELSV